MAATAAASVAMVVGLWGTAQFSLRSGHPRDVGRLSELQLGPGLANQWVRAEGGLEEDGAIRYQRPLSSDWFRLARAAGSQVWVEVRVPEELEGPHFLPPPSFVGRLVPLGSAGLSHGDLGESAASVHGAQRPAPGAWLLIDGDTPAASRWALGLIAILLGFAAFNLWGLWRLVRPLQRI